MRRKGRASRRRLPTILADEHIHESALGAVEHDGSFMVLRAARDRRFHGRDKRYYIGELRAQNIVFLTQNGEFVKHIVSTRVRHAGIIWLPAGRDADETRPD